MPVTRARGLIYLGCDEISVLLPRRRPEHLEYCIRAKPRWRARGAEVGAGARPNPICRLAYEPRFDEIAMNVGADANEMCIVLYRHRCEGAPEQRPIPVV